MKNNLDFRPGYYEWLIIKNDEIIKTLGTYFEELFDYDNFTLENVSCVVDEIIEGLEIEFEEEDIEPLTRNEEKALRELMIEQFSYHYSL